MIVCMKLQRYLKTSAQWVNILKSAARNINSTNYGLMLEITYDMISARNLTVKLTPEKAEEQKDEKGEKDDKDEKVIEKIVSDSPSNVEETENEEKKEEQWIIIAGEEPAKKANELDILTLGSGVVSKVAFNKSFSKNSVSVKGKVKCHGCNKMSIFSLESSRGWGGTKEPLTCPCGRSVEIGEYWSDIDNAIYVWASVNNPKEDLAASPLSITITRII